MVVELYDNVIELADGIDSEELVEIQKYLYKKEIEGVDRVGLIINSYGGDVGNAICIFDTIQSLKLHVDTLNAGYCESAGVIIFMAGENRYCYPHATFLMHEVRLEGGMSLALNESIESMQKLKYSRNTIIDIIQDRLYAPSLSRERLSEMVTGADPNSRFGAEFAYLFGFAKKMDEDCIFLPKKKEKLDCVMKDYVEDCDMCPRLCNNRKEES